MGCCESKSQRISTPPVASATTPAVARDSTSIADSDYATAANHVIVGTSTPPAGQIAHRDDAPHLGNSLSATTRQYERPSPATTATPEWHGMVHGSNMGESTTSIPASNLSDRTAESDGPATAPEFMPFAAAVPPPLSPSKRRVRIVYEDTGDVFEGEICDGVRKGYGRYTWANGATYEGYWERNDMNGKGVFTWPDGRRYRGEFAEDCAHGQGRYEYVDGSYYTGGFRYDRIDGHGFFVTRRGERHEVYWRDLEPTLAGIVIREGLPAPTRSLEESVPTGYWVCTGCTFFNEEVHPSCLMCGATRSSDAEVLRSSIRLIPSKVRRNYKPTPSDKMGTSGDESNELARACVVCLSAPRTHALIPCGHMCLCVDCVRHQARMKWCPMCRSEFQAALRVEIPPPPTRCRACETATRRVAAAPCGHLTLCESCCNTGAVTDCPVCNVKVRRWVQIYMLPINASQSGSSCLVTLELPDHHPLTNITQTP